MSEVKPIRYLMDVFPKALFRLKPVPVRGGPLALRPGQSQMGYGRRISSDYMVKIRKNWQRVLVCCISNTSTAYIEDTDGAWLVIRDGDMANVTTHEDDDGSDAARAHQKRIMEGKSS